MRRLPLLFLLPLVLALSGSASSEAPADGVILVQKGFHPTRWPELGSHPVRYVIVTTEDQGSVWQILADWKTQTGTPAVVRTMEAIGEEYEGVDPAERLRNFLRDAWLHWGTRYVLLAGDPGPVPIRFAHSWAWNATGGGIDILCDYYFACLEGSWNADGDHVFGEPIHGNENPLGDGADMGGLLDLRPDVLVGRLPLETPAEAQDYLEKYFSYTRTPAMDGYLSRSLLIGEVLFETGWVLGHCDTCGTCPPELLCVTLDGAEDCEDLIERLEPGPWNPEADVTRMYERAYLWGGIYPNVVPTSVEDMRGRLNDGVNVLVHVGHGARDRWEVGSVRDSLEEFGTEEVFLTSDALSLQNGDGDRLSGLVWSLTFQSAAVDGFSLGSALMTNPRGGTVTHVGSTNLNFPASAHIHQSIFFEKTFLEGSPTVGQAYYETMEERAEGLNDNVDTSRRFMLYSLILLGDPQAQVWLGNPDVLDVSFPAVIPLGEDVVETVVTDGGQPVAGALVTLRKDEESYAIGVTDAAGTISLPLLASTPGPFEIQATALQSLPAGGAGNVVESLDPVLSVASLGLVDDGSAGSHGNGNGRAEMGETVVIDLQVENTGPATAQEVTARLRWHVPTWEGIVRLEDSLAALGDIPPGGAAGDAEAFRLRIPRAVPEGMADSLRGGDLMSLALAIEIARKDAVRTYDWTLEGTRPLFVPFLNRVDDSQGDGDGVAENGEVILLDVGIWNRGLGTASFLEGTISADPPGAVVLLNETAPGEEIDSGDTGFIGPFEMQILDVDALTLFLEVRDTLGVEDDVVLERELRLLPPGAAGSLESESTHESISLLWENPAESGILGARIERSLWPGGRFEPVLETLVLGSVHGPRYYRDPGLEPLTAYDYRVVLVDSSGNGGPASDVLRTTTTPPIRDGWPALLGDQTRSSPVVTELDGAGEREILFGAEVVYGFEGSGSEYHDGDGDPATEGVLTHPPDEESFLLGKGRISSKAATSDLDGDHVPEVLVTTRDGSEEDNLRGVLMVFDNLGQELWRRTLDRHLLGSPAVAELDGDPEGEIVVACGSRLYAFDHDGTPVAEDSLGILLEIPGAVNLFQTPSVADLDGDGLDEVLLLTWNGADRDQPPFLYAVHGDGSHAEGFPVDLSQTGQGQVRSNTGTVSVADIDLDGTEGNPDLELLFLTGKRFWIFEHDGSLRFASPPGFDFDNSGEGQQSPAVGDLDRDGVPDVVFPLKGPGGLRLHALPGTMTAWDEGLELPGFPVVINEDSALDPGSPLLASANDDVFPEILIGDAEGRLHAFDKDGEIVPGFPILIPGADLRFGGVAVWDVDRSGMSNVVVQGAGIRDVFVFDLADTPFPDDPQEIALQNPWPMKFHDALNTSFAGSPLLPAYVPIPEEDLPEWEPGLVFDPVRPNPLGPPAVFRFRIPESQSRRTVLGVHDVSGRLVRRVFSGRLEPGLHEIAWDGRNSEGRRVSAGVYLARLRSGDDLRRRKFLLLR